MSQHSADIRDLIHYFNTAPVAHFDENRYCIIYGNMTI